jgi:hypothetical protein
VARFSFKSNTNELRTWLNKRKSSLEKRRQPFEALWKELREYYEPTLGKGLLEGDPEQVASQRDDEKILNTTPRLLLHRMAAGLQSGITNQSRRWFNFAALDNDLTEYSAVRQWLDSTAEAVSSAMNRSNVYPALDQTYLHLGQFGTAAGIIYPDDENTVHLRMIDCGNYWLGDDKRGRVTSVLERISMTLDQVVEEFGKGWTPDRIIERIKNGKGDERVTVWHLVQKHTRPDLIKDIAKDRKFMSIYWLDGQGRGDHNDGILAIRSFSYNPIIAPRWWTNNSVYGIGTGELGLGDTKQLQQLEADKLALVEQEIDPAMAAPASMKDWPLQTGAGGITYYPDMQGKGGVPITRMFETRAQIQPLLEAISATEQRLRQTFYADLFALMINLNMQPKQMTAREVNELSSEKVALLGPILTRLNTDLLNPLVDAVFAIAIKQGLVEEAPPILQGQELKVEYVSSLHVEQAAASRLTGLYKIAEFTGSLAQIAPSAVDKLDVDQMVDVAATSLVEFGVVRDDKKVAALRQARHEQEVQMAQAQAQAQQAKQMASAAKDLSQTPVGQGGTALDAILTGGRA